MPISDWNVFVDIPLTLDIKIDRDVPIIGIGSLRFEHTGSMLYSHANLVPNDSEGLSHGVVPAGKIRTVCRIDQHDGATAQISYFGLSAMNSQDDLVSGGSCYALIVASEEGLSNPTLNLHKFTSGLTDGLSVSSLDSIPFPGTLSVGTPFTLELEWVENISGLGGTFLVGRTGTLTDFSDLTDQVSSIDTSSPLSSSVSEGIVTSFKNNVSGDVKRVLFDNTILFELV